MNRRFGAVSGLRVQRLPGLTRLARSVWGTARFVAILFAATLDGRIRHALGLLHAGREGAVWIHRWCRRIVRCLGIECIVSGDLPGRLAESGQGFEAVVCNHLSYVDILLMSSARPFVMVAKTEVRGWPLLGWLTAQAGTVYVDRGGKPETYPAVNAAMARAYRTGLPVLFFPEGTTTDGSHVLEFRRGLFHSVLRDSVRVQSASLRYDLGPKDAAANVPDDICWWGDAEFLPHLFRFLGLRAVRAAIHFGPAIKGEDRFALARNGRETVASLSRDLTLGSRAGTGLAEADRPRHQTGLVQAL